MILYLHERAKLYPWQKGIIKLMTNAHKEGQRLFMEISRNTGKQSIYKEMAKEENGGWPERDKIPTTDPIGDVDDSSYKYKCEYVFKVVDRNELTKEAIGRIKEAWYETIKNIEEAVFPVISDIEVTFSNIHIDEEADFYKNLKKQCIHPEDKYDGPFFKDIQNDIINYVGIDIELPKTCCDNPQKYKNEVTANLRFWSCKNCGADLGNIDDC